MGSRRKRQDPERQITVIETPPCSTEFGRRYLLANAQEREELASMAPGMIVRLADEGEIDQLHGKSWEQLEKEFLDQELKALE